MKIDVDIKYMFSCVFFRFNLFGNCFFRKDLANVLGYGSFAEMSMETKMAGSIESAMAVIDR